MRASTYITSVLQTVVADRGWQWPAKASLDTPKDPNFGDVASNLAMVLAKQAGQKPRDLAANLREEVLQRGAAIQDIEIAGPGFLNVFFKPAFWQQTVSVIQEAGQSYGQSDMGQGRTVQLEYVSANPTGPLHIGHGRGAAVGDSLARILRRTGHAVTTEYYLNDAGRQMQILGASIAYRVLELLGQPDTFPEDHYQGGYIRDLAQELVDTRGASLSVMDWPELLEHCRQHGLTRILEGIKSDLRDFRVEHQVWFSEQSLLDKGRVEATLTDLVNRGLAYEQDGALWFASTTFGDDKDRVLRKSDGDLTYFASDIAYHADKYARGFDTVVDIWGADHHGYVPRMKGAVQALGRASEDLQVILVQLVNLLRDGEQVSMSTRAGKFETLADVCSEVGPDAARFIFLSRKSDSHLDFDLELVKRQSMDNPVYYVQYAHARINSVLRKGAERGFEPRPVSQADLALLDTAEDMDLFKKLDRFPEVVQGAARTLSPHHVSFYLQELSGLLHRYYNTHSVLYAESETLLQARFHLLLAVRQVLHNGLELLGVHAPEQM